MFARGILKTTTLSGVTRGGWGWSGRVQAGCVSFIKCSLSKKTVIKGCCQQVCTFPLLLVIYFQ